MAVGYTIVVLSPTGLLFGILWTRTRSLPLLVALHGATDLIPNSLDFARHFRLA